MTSTEPVADPAERPSHSAGGWTPRELARHAAGGFAMGSADLVPGVSGGTVALVLGFYERLVAAIREGAGALASFARLDARTGVARLKTVEWQFLVPLFAGILLAIVSLASILTHLLENEPIAMSGLFFGLIVGSIVIAADEIDLREPRTGAVFAVTTIAAFLLLGLRSGQIDDPSLPIYFAAGALAVCAMILPGISGSFILLMLGMYEPVLHVIEERDLATAAVVGAGVVIGLGSFSTVLSWTLARYRTIVLAALIGLMTGSLRVLWPWPAGEEGVGDTTLGAPGDDIVLALGLAVIGAAVVIVAARRARRLGAH